MFRTPTPPVREPWSRVAAPIAAGALLLAFGVYFMVAPVAGARDGRLVELELVLAVDSSTSVDGREFELQRQGLARAFLHPDVVRAIRAAGERGIAVTLVQWSGALRQATVVDWTHLHDDDSAAAFAARIASVPRAFTGFTDIAGAIRYSVASIENNGFEGARLAIDVSGDGTGDPQRSARARDRAVARGITINGLVIHSFDIDLEELANIAVREHYADHVIGGPGAFMMTAENFVDFADAIRRKLVREIAGPATAGLGPVLAK